MTTTRNTQPGQLRSGSVRSISRSWSGLASLQTWTQWKIFGGSWKSVLPSDSPETWRIWRRSVRRNGPKSLLQCVQTWSRTTGNVWNYKQRFLYQILRSVFLMYQILMSFNKLQINYFKIIQCDYLDFCFRFRHSQLKRTYDKNYRLLHVLLVGKPAKSVVYILTHPHRPAPYMQ